MCIRDSLMAVHKAESLRVPRSRTLGVESGRNNPYAHRYRAKRTRIRTRTVNTWACCSLSQETGVHQTVTRTTHIQGPLRRPALLLSYNFKFHNIIGKLYTLAYIL